MARSGRIIFTATLCFLIEIARISGSNDYTCSYVINANWCTVSNVTLQTIDEINAATFPNVSLINLKQPIINYLSPDLLKRMIVVDQMEIDAGIVPRIYIKPTLSRLSAHKNQVLEVIIDAEDNYYLEHLGIAYNRLRSVPKNINCLKHLVRLHLHDNEIEVVNMDLLKNLSRLKILALHRNKIHRLDTTVPLKLTNLAEIHLYGNQLEVLFVSLWDFPNLGTFHLALNKFRSIGRFPEHFPRLSVTALGGNRWSCAWLVRSLGPALKNGDLKVAGDKQCLDNKVAGICCDGKPEDFGEFLVESLTDQFQRINVWMIQQQRSIEELGRKMEAFHSDTLNDKLKNDEKIMNLDEQIGGLEDFVNKKIKHLQQDLQRIDRNHPAEVLEQFEWFQEKLNENRALIDDIIQDMYLEELRKFDVNT
ncbi:leucine-rich repeat transmembrane neuronal protein 1-like [Ochlerotatus camptorhynchus]|uniref:leucine-rich repeat transmembrane neuronal protein 1-like n=1 Tax=Ochlerotatus camptorhynchus TaxID=644619 RepID=UPI0031D6715C